MLYLPLCDNFRSFHVSSLTLFCMLLITSSRTSSIMLEKSNLADLCGFHILSFISPCARNNLKSVVSYSNLFCKFLITFSPTSSIMVAGLFSSVLLLIFFGNWEIGNCVSTCRELAK